MEQDVHGNFPEQIIRDGIISGDEDVMRAALAIYRSLDDQYSRCLGRYSDGRSFWLRPNGDVMTWKDGSVRAVCAAAAVHAMIEQDKASRFYNAPIWLDSYYRIVETDAPSEGADSWN